MFWPVLILFALILLGGFGAFLTLEIIAIRSIKDEINTLSWYLKRWRRRDHYVRSTLLIGAVQGTAVWLIGHLVFEWW